MFRDLLIVSFRQVPVPLSLSTMIDYVNYKAEQQNYFDVHIWDFLAHKVFSSIHVQAVPPLFWVDGGTAFPAFQI